MDVTPATLGVTFAGIYNQKPQQASRGPLLFICQMVRLQLVGFQFYGTAFFSILVAAAAHCF